MKALVVGCGSIGRRHINNLVKLDKIDSIFVCTKVKDCLKILDNSEGKIKPVKSLDGIQADLAIVCNETYKHLETAVLLAEKGINVFIEKPISHNLDGLDKLRKVVTRKKVCLSVGYNLRFLGAMRYIKEQLTSGIIGNLYFAKIEAGQYLPHWRQNIDYADCYSASRKKGGGVALDLSHEIDYMRYLFGEPEYWKVIKARVSDLKIDSDDIFEGLYVFGNNFVCNVHLDYLQMYKKRDIRIIGSKGVIECNFVKKEIKIKTDKGKEAVIIEEDLFDINRTYADELNHFIKSLESGSMPDVTLDDGIKALNLIEDINV